MAADAKITLSVSFAEVALPPFRDILILGKRCPHGKSGVQACLNLLAPDNFDLVEVEDALVEAILVHKRILKRIPAETIVGVLRDRVFPYITKGETVKVDFAVTVGYDNIEIDVDDK